MAAFNTRMVKSVTLLSVILCVLLASESKAASKSCPPFHYPDHGTGHCEHCCDICCNANITKTFDDCQTFCPAYAKKLEDDKKKVEDPGLPGFQPSTENNGGSNHLSLAVGIPVAIGLSVFAVVSLLFVLKRRNQHRQGRGGNVPPVDELESVGLSQQEEGEEGPTEGPVAGTSVCDPRNFLTYLRSHIDQETVSGQLGADAMALPDSTRRPIYIGSSGAIVTPSGSSL